MENTTNQADKNSSSVGIKISMIFSFKNEEDVIPELISRVRNVLRSEIDKNVISDYELIFVNDRSTDQSEKLLKEINVDHGDIKIINMSRTFGVSPCVMTGLKFSTGDAAIYMDADLQDPPELIPEMLETWKHGDDVDIVHTVRTSRAGEPFLKLQITKIGYWILRRSASIDLIAEAGDFKLLSRRAVDHINQLNEYNPYMRGMVAWLGFNQAKVYYKREMRSAGATKFPVFSRKVINNFFSSALISFSSAPLQWASISGLVGFIFSIGMFLIAVYQQFAGIAFSDWFPIVTAILFIGSIQLMGLGILGLYIQSIYIAAKKRPNYIIENIFGFSEEELRVLRKTPQKDHYQVHTSQ